MKILPDMGISLLDGTRLSAKVWMPEGVESEPVPAILEYLPYRKSDGTAARDHGMHLHFAQAGYVCLRVDRRGCGDSEGLFDDEYSETELQDGVDVINWIEAQPWCDGNVGMQGISWGGFNAVQIAARAPKPLKAVISIGSTVDRFNDDIHYKGGVQLADNVGWAATMLSWSSTPPDPELVGHDRWRDIWINRLQNAPFLADTWLGHPNRDEYWKHGSICEDFSAIKAPVLAIGGLHDGYRNAMAAMVEGITAPVKGIAGPWSHKYPNISNVGPSIDYLGEALRWWDHWLKGKDTGVDKDPAYRAYLMDSIEPDPSLNFRPGRWVACPEWPSPDITHEKVDLERDQGDIETDLACGRGFGEFFPFGFGPGELPDDQGHDDALAACFDSPPMTEDREILGAPCIRLNLAADTERAQMIIRLCDLRPDGTSALITLGMLNLRHRDGFEQAKDLTPGETYEIALKLDQSAYRLPKGHKLRVAISPSYWPYCWPEGVTATLSLSAVELTVPWYQARSGDAYDFNPPEPMQERPYRKLNKGHEHKTWRENPETGEVSLEIFGDHGRQEDLENGLITESSVSETWRVNRNDPASAHAEIIWTRSLGRGDWEINTKVTTQMRGEAHHYVVTQRLEAFDSTGRVIDRKMESTVPRSSGR